MLSTRVESLAHLMTIALRAERAAARRYVRLAQDMQQAGNQSAADLFERMVTEEREHERRLVEWMAADSIEEIADPGPVRWFDPKLARTYDEEARDPRYSTPYRALALAVTNEENAFRFYTHVAAQADDESVRLQAEALAREELEHAALFRAERRRAYHAELAGRRARALPDPGEIQSETELRAVAIRVDRYFADRLDRQAARYPQLSELTRKLRAQIEVHEQHLAGLAEVNLSQALAELPALLAFSDADTGEGESELRRLALYNDRSFAFYDSIVDNAGDDSILRAAQCLAALALDRTATLKRLCGDRASMRES